MFEFHRPDPALAKLLVRQKLRAESVYVLSPFTVMGEADGEWLCFSTLTKQGFVLPAGFDPKGRYSAAQIEADPELRTLMEGYFLKPEERDENELYLQINTLMRTFEAGRGGFICYTILPTTACNARCTYCFQENYQHITMSRETIRQTLDFILRSKRPGSPLLLNWFGGEPLLCPDAIDFIINGLRENGVEYRSVFTTNGSLISSEMAARMADDWKTASVQITLDGGEEAYRRIKRYVHLEDAYSRVLQGIRYLTDRDVSVSVRINLDGTNGGEVPKALADLSRIVTNKEKVNLYFSPIFQIRESERCLEGWKETEVLSRQIEAYGFPPMKFFGIGGSFHAFRCMASKCSDNILITPAGRLGLCEHLVEGPLYGSVAEGITDPKGLHAFSDDFRPLEKCRNCPFLPSCTGFRSCPTFDYHCRELRMLRSVPGLREMLEKARRGEAEAEPDETEAQFRALADIE